MNEIIIILVVVFFLFFFSLNDETVINVSKKAQFRIGLMSIMLYFFYNNMTDGAVLIFFLIGVVLMLKPELKNEIMLKINIFYNENKT